ncbi:isochorismatase family cysteine hydrolase [Ensifer sp. ENS04]|uniref:cysteine hydrolase family protein n=1 Tax=Ensifer sp. ENS04 TaxID=2769281 RepID=UPI0032B26C94
MAAKLEIGKTLEDFCRPERMALIVYDMQVGITNQVKNGPAVLSKVLKVLDAARAGGFPVIFLRHLSMPRPLMGAFQLRQAMAWQRTDDPDAVHPWFLRGTPGSELVPELAPRDDEAILDKITFSAFEGTPLAMILRDLGLTSFAICGIATEIGSTRPCAMRPISAWCPSSCVTPAGQGITRPVSARWKTSPSWAMRS